MAITRRSPTTRDSDLKTMLERRRRELVNELSSKMRDVRTQSSAQRGRSDEHGGGESDAQSDIDLALMQMKSETLARIDAALRRLADRTYGNCAECKGPISRERLCALPFAVRCTNCEQRREIATRERQTADQRRAFGVLYADTPA